MARKTALNSIRRCLFSNEEFSGVKKCLDHMRLKYSFVIPNIDCLVDLKGLLTYLAERIHLGGLCLYCNKQFADGQSCQQHMIDKGHCMINMDDEDEYADFYDFSKTYENHPLLVKDENQIEEDKAAEDAGQDDGWEDCDVEDGDE